MWVLGAAPASSPRVALAPSIAWTPLQDSLSATAQLIGNPMLWGVGLGILLERGLARRDHPLDHARSRMTRRPAVAVPYVLLGVTVFFWGSAFHATAVGTEHASAVVFSTLRALPAALVLLAVTALVRGRIPRGRPLAWAAVSGLLMVTLTFEGIAEGTTLAGAGNAAVLVNTTPFFVLLLGRAFLGERIASWGVIGLVTAFVGVVVMVSSQLGGDASTGDMALGMGIALASGAGFGVGTLLVKATTTRYPDTDLKGFAAVQHLVGGIALIPLALAYGDVGDTDWGSRRPVGRDRLGGDRQLGDRVRWPTSRRCGSSRRPARARGSSSRRWSRSSSRSPTATRRTAIVLAGMALVIAGVAVVSIAPARAAARAGRAARDRRRALEVEPGLARRPAAVDRQEVPGDERRGLRAEEDRGAGDVLGLTDAPERDPLDRRVVDLLDAQHRLGHRRPHERRGDRVDPDAVRRPVDRLAAGHRRDRALRGRVDDLVGQREDRRLRGEIDDRPAAAGRMSGNAACAQNSLPFTLTRQRRSRSSSVASSAGTFSLMTAAQFTTPSTRPSVATIARTRP